MFSILRDFRRLTEAVHALAEIGKDLVAVLREAGPATDRLEALDKPTDSLMPVFGSDRLSEGDLNDLVSYLQTLRGFDPAVQ